MCDGAGWQLLGWETGQDKISHAGGADGAVVQWHGTSLPGNAWTWHCDTGVHMEIIMKFSEALPCVKSPVSRTLGPIYVVMCVENVLVRTPWKETWLELEKAGVETTKGWKVSRESDGKRVGRVMESE